MAADLAELCRQIDLLRQHFQARELDMQSSMSKAQEQHDGLVRDNNSRYETAIAKWESHCEDLKSQLTGSSRPSTLSPTETDKRMALANIAKEGSAIAVAESAPSGAAKAAKLAENVGANY